jgi:rhodanese-related sulfurtransferase
MNIVELSHAIDVGSSVRVLDVRTPGEFGNHHIHGAYNVPLDQLAEHAPELRAVRGGLVVLVCQSGQRANRAEALLQQAGMPDVHVLEGGMAAWMQAGLPTRRTRARISLERQVRIAASSLVAVGALAALTISPLLAVVPALIGSGLVFAGLTDTCAMGMLLAKLPYNRGASCDTEAMVRRFVGADQAGRP